MKIPLPKSRAALEALASLEGVMVSYQVGQPTFSYGSNSHIPAPNAPFMEQVMAGSTTPGEGGQPAVTRLKTLDLKKVQGPIKGVYFVESGIKGEKIPSVLSAHQFNQPGTFWTGHISWEDIIKEQEALEALPGQDTAPRGLFFETTTVPPSDNDMKKLNASSFRSSAARAALESVDQADEQTQNAEAAAQATSIDKADPAQVDPAAVPVTPAAGAQEPAAEPAADPATDPAGTPAAPEGGQDPAAGEPADPAATPAAEPATEPAAPAADTAEQTAATDAQAADADADTPETDLPNDGDALDEEVETVIGELAKADKADGQISDIQSDVVELTAATEALLDQVNMLSLANQRGGMDQIAAMQTRKFVNYVTTRLDAGKLPQSSMAALEDMETPGSKIATGESVKRQVMEFVKRMIAKIKEGLASVAEFFSKRYANLTSATAAIRTRAEKIKQRAAGAADRSEEVSDAKALTALAKVGAEPIAPSALAKEVGVFSATVDRYNDPALYSGLLDVLGELVKVQSGTGGFEEILPELRTRLDKYVKGITAGTESSGESFAVSSIAGTTVQITVPRIQEDGSFAFGASKREEAGELKKPASAKALSIKELTALCDEVIKAANEFDKSVAATDGAVKKVGPAVASYAKNLGDADMQTDPARAEAIKKVVTFYYSVVGYSPSMPYQPINRALPSVLTAALDYAAASLPAPSTKTDLATA